MERVAKKEPEEKRQVGRAKAKPPKVKLGYQKKIRLEWEKQLRKERHRKIEEIYKRRNKKNGETCFCGHLLFYAYFLFSLYGFLRALIRSIQQIEHPAAPDNLFFFLS
jgi:hypothetical protein